jgi:hypothetical protein
MVVMNRYYGLALGLLVVATPGAGQELEIGGEIRPRFEVRDPVAGPGPGENVTQEQTSMRSRLSVETELADAVRVLVQLQDVRIWGAEEGTTDASAPGLDLHQGWIEVGDPTVEGLALRAGRQELAYGGERLIGALNWAQQARSFDGARLRFRRSEVTLDGIATWIGDSDAGRPDETLHGVHGTLELGGIWDGYLLFHSRDRLVGTANPRSEDASNTYTVGARWTSASGGVDWRVEAAYQAGEIRFLIIDPVAWTDFRDVGAYLLAARVGTRPLEDLTVTLWYDRLSGDDDPVDDEYRVFDTLFATNHKFYGHMDLFLNIPEHTAGRGLQDLALKAAYDLRPAHSVGADLHTFRVAAAGGLETGHIGEELDLAYRWGYAPGVTLTGGLSVFLAGEAWSDPAGLANQDDDMVWGYVMLDVAF